MSFFLKKSLSDGPPGTVQPIFWYCGNSIVALVGNKIIGIRQSFQGRFYDQPVIQEEKKMSGRSQTSLLNGK